MIIFMIVMLLTVCIVGNLKKMQIWFWLIVSYKNVSNAACLIVVFDSLGKGREARKSYVVDHKIC